MTVSSYSDLQVSNIGRNGNQKGEFINPAGMALFDKGSLVTECNGDLHSVTNEPLSDT